MSEAWAGGSTREWRRIRAAELEENRIRTGGQCLVRVRGVCSGIATTVHHVKGRSVTGDDPRWLAASCVPCNLHIGDPQTHPADCSKCVGPDPKPIRLTEW